MNLVPTINPVLRRELLLTLRRKRSAGLLFVMLAGLGWVLLANWSESDTITLARTIFSLFGVVTINVMFFVAPLLTAASITREREERTFDMLTTANLGPWRVLLGKLGASLGLILLLISICAPLFAMVFLLGGVSVGEFCSLMAFIFLIALSYGMVGLAASALFRSSLAAVIAALAYTALIAWLPLFVGMGMSPNSGFNSINFTAPVYWPSFVAVLGCVRGDVPITLTASFFRLAGAEGVWGSVLGFVACGPAYFLIIQAALMALLARLFYGRGSSKFRVSSVVLIDDPEVLRKRRERFPYYLIDPRRRRPPIRDNQNPMSRKDSQTLLVGNKTRIIRMAYVVAFVSIWLGIVYQTGSRAWNYIFIMYLGGAMAAALAAVLAIQADQAGHRLDLIRASGLSPRQFLHAKILVPLRFALLMEAVALVISIHIGAWMTGKLPWQELELNGAILLYALEAPLLGALLGVVLGICTRHTAVALIGALMGCLFFSLVALPVDLSDFGKFFEGFLTSVLGGWESYGRGSERGVPWPTPALWFSHAWRIAGPIGLGLYLLTRYSAQRILAPQDQ